MREPLLSDVQWRYKRARQIEHSVEVYAGVWWAGVLRSTTRVNRYCWFLGLWQVMETFSELLMQARRSSESYVGTYICNYVDTTTWRYCRAITIPYLFTLFVANNRNVKNKQTSGRNKCAAFDFHLFF